MIGDADRFRKLSREFAQLEPVATALAAEAQAQRDLAAAEAMRGDPELRELAEEEIAAASARLEQLDAELLAHLIPKDPRDEGDIYLEVRAGTGGDEAAIFAGDLFRMYARYAERQGWKVEIESASPGEHGGFKEVIARVEGPRRVFAAEVRIRHAPRAARAGDRIAGPHPHLGGDGGDHPGRGRGRADRDQSGRPARSTPSAPAAPAASTSTRPSRRSASPTCPAAMVVESQTERSQHANRDKAMKRLKAMLAEAQAAKAAAAQAETRKLQVGSGDRSQRIRTYNFPQGRITDHRVEGLTLYDLPNVIEGDLDDAGRAACSTSTRPTSWRG